MAGLEDWKTVVIRRLIPAGIVLVLGIMRYFAFFSWSDEKILGAVILEHYGEAMFWIPFACFFLATIFLDNGLPGLLLQAGAIMAVIACDWKYLKYCELRATGMFWASIALEIVLLLYCTMTTIHYRKKRHRRVFV